MRINIMKAIQVAKDVGPLGILKLSVPKFYKVIMKSLYKSEINKLVQIFKNAEFKGENNGFIIIISDKKDREFYGELIYSLCERNIVFFASTSPQIINEISANFNVFFVQLKLLLEAINQCKFELINGTVLIDLKNAPKVFNDLTFLRKCGCKLVYLVREKKIVDESLLLMSDHILVDSRVNHTNGFFLREDIKVVNGGLWVDEVCSLITDRKYYFAGLYNGE